MNVQRRIETIPGVIGNAIATCRFPAMPGNNQVVPDNNIVGHAVKAKHLIVANIVDQVSIDAHIGIRRKAPGNVGQVEHDPGRCAHPVHDVVSNDDVTTADRNDAGVRIFVGVGIGGIWNMVLPADMVVFNQEIAVPAQILNRRTALWRNVVALYRHVPAARCLDPPEYRGNAIRLYRNPLRIVQTDPVEGPGRTRSTCRGRILDRTDAVVRQFDIGALADLYDASAIAMIRPDLKAHQPQECSCHDRVGQLDARDDRHRPRCRPQREIGRTAGACRLGKHTIIPVPNKNASRSANRKTLRQGLPGCRRRSRVAIISVFSIDMEIGHGMLMDRVRPAGKVRSGGRNADRGFAGQTGGKRSEGDCGDHERSGETDAS